MTEAGTPETGRIVASGFRPAAGLANRHVQSLLGGIPATRRPRVSRERWELADGDFVDLDWLATRGRRWALVLPGLTGSLASAYALRLLRHLADTGFRAALLNYRGLSGMPNRLATGYHAGFTRDVDAVTRRLAARHGPGVVAGYSMGGNLLLKWLGEAGSDVPVLSAAAVSVPFDLAAAAYNLRAGPARPYDRYLRVGLRRYVRRKFRRPAASPVALPDLRTLASIEEFDDRITAPLHGFADAADYYARSSSRRWLRHIRVPTLIVNALDDPLVPRATLPSEDELSPCVTLAVSGHGGHVGFLGRGARGLPRFWLEPYLLQHLAAEPAPGQAA